MNSIQKFFDGGSNVPAEIINTAPYLKKTGIVLSEKDCAVIVASRSEALTKYRRIDLSATVVTELIKTFSSSVYAENTSFAALISELCDIFYEFRGDIPRSTTDKEIITFMFSVFENSCHGTTELLREREMVRFASALRRGEAYDGEEERFDREYD